MSKPRQVTNLIGTLTSLSGIPNTGRAPVVPVLEFEYENWRGDEHVYVVNFRHPDTNCTLELAEMGDPEHEGWETERSTHLLLSGYVVTRDSDPRPEMGDNRRRSFQVEKMRNIKPAEETA